MERMSALVSLLEIPVSSLGFTVQAAARLAQAQCVWSPPGVTLPEDLRRFQSAQARARGGDLAEIIADLCESPRPAAFLLPPGFPLQDAIARLRASNLTWERCPALSAGRIAAATVGLAPKFVADLNLREWDPGSAPPTCSKRNQPLVFVAAPSGARLAAQTLIDAGWPADIPVLQVSDAGTPRQKSVETTLREAGEAFAGQHPATFFVSQSGFRARAEWNFFERRPLFGKRILTTRAEHQAGDFLSLLTEYGAHAESLPTIHIADPTSWDPLDAALEKLKAQSHFDAPERFYEWLFFTSVNGVERFWKRLRRHGADMRALGGTRVCAIGPATAAALAALNIAVDLIPTEFKAEGVIESFVAFYGGAAGVAGRRILLPRARVARDTLPVELAKLGAHLEIVETYQTVSPKIDAKLWESRLRDGEFDVVTFTSSSTVTQFAKLFPNAHLAELLHATAVACIGPVTGDTARRCGLEVAVQPKDYTIPALAQSIADFFCRSENV
jgi:uroporphyrinogen-III synthase